MSNILKKGRKVKLNNISYKVEGFLGKGGSGEVYKMSEGSQFFALKLFFPYYR